MSAFHVPPARFVLLAWLAFLTRVPAAGQPGRWARLAIADSLSNAALAAYRSGRNAEAAPLFVEVADDALAADRPGALYNAACSFALDGQYDTAVRTFGAAVQAGWDNGVHMQADGDLVALHGRPEWEGLVVRAAANLVARRARRAAVDSVRIVTEDIPRFWAAVDAAAPALAARDTAAATAVFERASLDPGTDALLGYVRAKVPGGPRAYAVTLMRYPAYYASIRVNTLALRELGPEIRASLRRLTALYPYAAFPEISLVVGVLTAGGTSLQQGLLLGVEMNTAAPGSPLGEMSVGLRGIIAPTDHLPHVVVHELVHANQNTSGQWTVLRNVLIEGGADFLTDLVRPGAPTAHYTAWGRARPGRLDPVHGREGLARLQPLDRERLVPGRRLDGRPRLLRRRRDLTGLLRAGGRQGPGGPRPLGDAGPRGDPRGVRLRRPVRRWEQVTLEPRAPPATRTVRSETVAGSPCRRPPLSPVPWLPEHPPPCSAPSCSASPWWPRR